MLATLVIHHPSLVDTNHTRLNVVLGHHSEPAFGYMSERFMRQNLFGWSGLPAQQIFLQQNLFVARIMLAIVRVRNIVGFSGRW